MKHCFEKAYAKINLTLDVIAKRPDGYHDLKMIMQSVTLHDNIAVRIGTGEGIKSVSNLGYLPDDDRNIAVKAAREFFAATGVECDGVHIAIEKNIPVAAGLAGGSTDGAAVLRALNTLYSTGLSTEELCEIGLKVGADVPFCVRGGTMLAEGIGEILTPLADMPECHIVLCKPGYGMSTAKVFGSLKVDEIKRHPDTDRVIAALAAGNIREIANNMYNVLEEIVASEKKSITSIERKMMEFGALGAVMSGSGSTTFGIFDDESKAQRAYKNLKAKYKETYLAKSCSIL